MTAPVKLTGWWSHTNLYFLVHEWGLIVESFPSLGSIDLLKDKSNGIPRGPANLSTWDFIILIWISLWPLFLSGLRCWSTCKLAPFLIIRESNDKPTLWSIVGSIPRAKKFHWNIPIKLQPLQHQFTLISMDFLIPRKVSSSLYIREQSFWTNFTIPEQLSSRRMPSFTDQCFA